MQRRATRLVILCLLLGGGALAAFFAVRTEWRLQSLDSERHTKEATLDRLLQSIGAIATAQQAYVDYGRHDVAAFTRVSRLVDRLTTDAAGLRATNGAEPSGARLEEFWTALSALMGAESRAREHLAGGDDVAAADAMLASSRVQVSTLDSTLRAFAAAELESYRTARSAAQRRAWAAIAGAGALLVVGLIVFAIVPLRQREVVIHDVVRPAPEPEPLRLPPSVDLQSTADVSADLARLTDPESLPQVLQRIGGILDARGVIVWMDNGETLIAAAAHGYDAAVLQRIPPIARAADNATAAAWRTGMPRTVPADDTGYGAIVAPMAGPSGCLGVLAAEVRGGREGDAAVQSVALILASQLASVLGPWPGEAPSVNADALDRQAAAS